VGLTWTNDTFSYFTLVNDFSRRTKLASKATMSELANPVYDLTALSDQKRQVQYTQENIFRTLISPQTPKPLNPAGTVHAGEHLQNFDLLANP
jgi:hypothetical protein